MTFEKRAQLDAERDDMALVAYMRERQFGIDTVAHKRPGNSTIENNDVLG